MKILSFLLLLVLLPIGLNAQTTVQLGLGPEGNAATGRPTIGRISLDATIPIYSGFGVTGGYMGAINHQTKRVIDSEGAYRHQLQRQMTHSLWAEVYYDLGYHFGTWELMEAYGVKPSATIGIAGSINPLADDGEPMFGWAPTVRVGAIFQARNPESPLYIGFRGWAPLRLGATPMGGTLQLLAGFQLDKLKKK